MHPREMYCVPRKRAEERRGERAIYESWHPVNASTYAVVDPDFVEKTLKVLNKQLHDKCRPFGPSVKLSDGPELSGYPERYF